MSKIIAGIIEKYLGEFVVLDKEKFDISLFTETRIQNVAIRPDLLTQFVDSPIYGHVECISINPNVGNNKPLEIKVSGIYIALLLTNGDASKSIDPIEAKRRRLAANDLVMHQNYKDELALSKLSAAELQERVLKQQQQQEQGGGGGARKDTNDASIGEKFARRMLKKIYFKIEGLHVRVETDGACFGIVMNSLTLETNREIKPTDAQSPRNTFILDGLGIYIDRPNAPGESCPARPAEFVRHLAAGIRAPHDYILRPYTTGFSLTWALKHSSAVPLPPARYTLSGNMADLSIVLSKEQYNRLYVALDSLKQPPALPEAVREKRPAGAVRENPLGWFRYAGEAVLFHVRDRRTRRSEKFLSERFAVKKKYCALYQRKLTKKIRVDEVKELEKLDMTLDINDIMFFRSFAVAEMNISFVEKLKGIRSSQNRSSQLALASRASSSSISSSSSSTSSTGSFANSLKRSFSFRSDDKKTTSPSSLPGSTLGRMESPKGSGSIITSSSSSPFGGLKKFSLLKEIKMGGDDDDDDDLVPESNKSQGIFTMNVSLMSFSIILQNGSSTNTNNVGTPLLSLKADTIRVNLAMPTQLTTNVGIRLYNLTGTYHDPVSGEKSTLLTYVPEAQQQQAQSQGSQPPALPQPFVGVTLNKRDDYLGVKATVRPLEIVLTERVAEHLAHFLLPPDEVNVMELGNQIMAFIYMYVLVIDDSLSDTNITPGPGKALEKLGLDATIKELTIRVKSADDTSELDIGIGQILAKSDAYEARSSIDQRRTSLDQRRPSIDQRRTSLEKSRDAAKMAVSVEGIYVGVPRRSSTDTVTTNTTDQTQTTQTQGKSDDKTQRIQDKTDIMHIIPPFNVGAEVSLPFYSSKKGGNPIVVSGTVETVDVVLSEEAVYRLLDLEKSFCRILVPIACKYLSSLAKNLEMSGKASASKSPDGTNASGTSTTSSSSSAGSVGSGAISAAAAAAAEKGSPVPIKFNGTVQGVVVSWLGKRHDRAVPGIVTVVVGDIRAAGSMANGCFQGEFGIPEVRVRDGRRGGRTQLRVSEVAASVFAPEAAAARVRCTVTAVESWLETAWLAEVAGSTAEVALSAVRVLNRDIISVVTQHHASLAVLAAQAHKLFLIEIAIPSMRFAVLNGPSALAIEVAGTTATAESPHAEIVTALATVRAVRICSGTLPTPKTTAITSGEEEEIRGFDTSGMLDLVRVGSSSEDLPIDLAGDIAALARGDTAKRPSALRQKAAVRLDLGILPAGCKAAVRVGDVFVSTQDIANVLRLAVGAGKELAAALPAGLCAELAELAKSLLFDPDSALPAPAVGVDFVAQDLAVDLVPPYAPTETYRVRIARVAFANSPENICGAARIEGVEMWGRDAPMLAEPLTITATPAVRIDKAAREVVVGASVAITPVELVLVAEHVQGLAFLCAAGSILLLSAPLWDGDVFPSFVRVDLASGIRIPHVGIAFRTSTPTMRARNVLNVCIDNLAITGGMTCRGQTFAITAETLVVKPACEDGDAAAAPAIGDDGGAIVPSGEGSGRTAMCLRVGRKKTEDAVTFTADVDVGGLVMEAFDSHTIFRGFLPLAKRIVELGIDFRAFRAPGMGRRGRRAVVLNAGVSLGKGLTLRYGEHAVIRVAPIAVSLGARANGGVESLVFRTSIDDGVVITDKFGNEIVTVARVAVNVDSCLDVTVSNVKVSFWPGIISNTVFPIICDMSRLLLASAKEEDELTAAAAEYKENNSDDTNDDNLDNENEESSGLCVPSFLDKYTVNVAVEDIVVDVRRAVKAEDGRVVAVISGLRVQPPSALERGKPLISSIFTDTRLDIDKIYTVCGGFTQGLADDMRIAFSITPTNDLIFRTIQLTLGFGRNHLAAFYSLALAFKQVKLPPLSLIIPPELIERAFIPKPSKPTKAQPSSTSAVVASDATEDPNKGSGSGERRRRKRDVRIRCELPEITLAWVDCFTCTISHIEFGFAGTASSNDIDIKVRSVVIADNHVDKMAAHPILSLLEEADGSPAVGVHIKIAEEEVGPSRIVDGEDNAAAAAAALLPSSGPRKRRVVRPTIRMSVIDVFATPEIIDTTVGDIKWMQNYNIRVFDDDVAGAGDGKNGKEEEEEEDPEKERLEKEQDAAMKAKLAEAFSHFELKVALEFMIGGISAHFYEDYTALYCIGAFGVSLDRLAVAVVTPSVRQAEGQKLDIEELEVAVRDMRVAAGFRCSSSGEEEGGPRAVSLCCPRVRVWITDGVLSSLTVGMDSLNVDVQAELLTAFVEHASRIRLNVSVTRAKNVVRHADMRHAPWDIDSASINEVEKMDARPPGVLDMVAAMKAALDKGMSAKVTLGDINIAVRTFTGYSLALNVANFECLLDDVELRRIQLVFSAQVLEHDTRAQLMFPWKILVSVLNNTDTPSVQVQMLNLLMVEINPQGLKSLCAVLDAIRTGFPDDYEPVFTNAFEIPVFTPPLPASAEPDAEEGAPAGAAELGGVPREVERSLVLESAFAREVLDVRGTATSRPTVGSDLHRVTVAGWGTRTWEGGIPPGFCGLTVRNEATGRDLCLVLKRRMSPSGEAGATVRSLLQVHNKTDFDLGLVFGADASARMELRPRSSAYAPPNFVAVGKEGGFCVEADNTRSLSKRSAGEHQRHQSAPVALQRRRPGARYLEELRVERPDSAEGRRRWFYLTLAYDVSPQKIPAVGSGEAFYASRATFLPTLYVENGLPTHATVELTDLVTRELVRVSVDSGTTTSILDIQRKEAISIMATITVATHPSAPVIVGTLRATLKYPSPKADPAEQLRPGKKGARETVAEVTFPKMSEFNGIICAGLSQDEGTGVWKIRLFSRYILMNTTGLHLEVWNGTLLPLENTDGAVFLVNFRPSKGLYLRKAGSKEWSRAVDVEYGFNGTVDIPGADCTVALKADPERDSSGVSLRMYLRPMYTVYNELGFAVHVRQPLSKHKERAAGRALNNLERTDVFCTISGASKDSFITLQAEGFLESEPIDISTYTESKSEAICIHSSTDKGSFKIIHIEVKRNEDITRIALYDDDGTAPVILQNFSSLDLDVCQKGFDKYARTVPPNKQVHFAWDSLAKERRALLSIRGMKNVEIDVSKGAASGKFIVRDAQREKHLILWQTSTDNGITIVRFIPRPMLSTLIESEALMPCYLKNPTGERFFKFALMLPQIRITVENETTQILAIMVEGIGLTYTLDDSGHNIDAALESVDISNRLPNAVHKKIFTNKVAATSKVRDSNLVEFSLKQKLRATAGEIHDISKLYGRLSPISLSLDEELVLTLIFLIEGVIPKDLLKPKGSAKLPKGAAISEGSGDGSSEVSSDTRSVRTYRSGTDADTRSIWTNRSGTSEEFHSKNGSEKQLAEEEEEEKRRKEKEEEENAAAAAAAAAAVAASAPFYVRDLSISGISLNFSCYPARKEFKKQFEHVKKSKRLVSIISLVYGILGNFSNSSVVVTPLQYEEMMFPNGDKFQQSIVSHFVPQLINKIVDSARGSGLLSSVTFLAKAATKAGLMNAIFK